MNFLCETSWNFTIKIVLFCCEQNCSKSVWENCSQFVCICVGVGVFVGVCVCVCCVCDLNT